ncbi:hypothetical protein QQS21_004970 [Conoideocrella luteorostrata]|uniref:Uncharacterized protein n=1 Tax=Conoideocrella luteorostrata TaxID=1105319 RepID=A0AAJ0FUZ9_9HYPO|nr:hypothetical protein QQS21_004970 [Conoideocrella luteorostrata]
MKDVGELATVQQALPKERGRRDNMIQIASGARGNGLDQNLDQILPYSDTAEFPSRVMDLSQHDSAGSPLGNEADEGWVGQNTDGHQRMVSSPRRCTTPVTPSEGIDANIALQSFDRGQSPTLAASPSGGQSSYEHCTPALDHQSEGINVDSFFPKLEDEEIKRLMHDQRDVPAKKQDVGGIAANSYLPEFDQKTFNQQSESDQRDGPAQSEGLTGVDCPSVLNAAINPSIKAKQSFPPTESGLACTNDTDFDFPLDQGATKMSARDQHKVSIWWGEWSSSAGPSQLGLETSDNGANMPETGPKGNNACLLKGKTAENTIVVTTSIKQVVDFGNGTTTMPEIRTKIKASVTRHDNKAMSTQCTQSDATRSWPPPVNPNSLISQGLPEANCDDTDWVYVEDKKHTIHVSSDSEQSDSSSGSPSPAQTDSGSKYNPNDPKIDEEPAESIDSYGIKVYSADVFFRKPENESESKDKIEKPTTPGAKTSAGVHQGPFVASSNESPSSNGFHKVKKLATGTDTFFLQAFPAQNLPGVVEGWDFVNVTKTPCNSNASKAEEKQIALGDEPQEGDLQGQDTGGSFRVMNESDVCTGLLPYDGNSVPHSNAGSPVLPIRMLDCFGGSANTSHE